MYYCITIEVLSLSLSSSLAYFANDDKTYSYHLVHCEVLPLKSRYLVTKLHGFGMASIGLRLQNMILLVSKNSQSKGKNHKLL